MDKIVDDQYPFPFLNQGISIYRKSMSGFIWFKEPPSVDDRIEIMATKPELVEVHPDWVDKRLWFHTDDALCYLLLDPKGESIPFDDYDYDEVDLPTDDQWQKFHDQITAWLQGIHACTPIAFAYKTVDFEYGYHIDSWGEWSSKQVFSSILPTFYREWPALSSKEAENILQLIIEAITETAPGTIKASPKQYTDLIRCILESAEHEETGEWHYTMASHFMLKLSKKNRLLEIARFSSYEQLLLFSNGVGIKLFRKLEDQVQWLWTCEKDLQGKDQLAPEFYFLASHVDNVETALLLFEKALGYSNATPAMLINALNSYYSISAYQKRLQALSYRCLPKFKDPAQLSMLFYEASQKGYQFILSPVIDLLLATNNKLAIDEYTFSNALSALNSIYSHRTVQLCDLYLEQPNRKMLASLYINILFTYAMSRVVNTHTINVLNEAIELLKARPKYYSTLIGGVTAEMGDKTGSACAAIASVFAVMNESDNAYEYLVKAQKNGYPLTSLYDSTPFTQLRNTPKFKNYFYRVVEEQTSAFTKKIANKKTSSIDRYNSFLFRGLIYHDRAIIEYSQDYARLAEEDYKAALTIFSIYPDPYINLANIYATLIIDRPLSLQLYGQAIHVAPDYYLSYNNRSELYAAMGDYTLALRDAEKAIERNSKTHYPFNSRGLAYYGLKQYENALKDFEQSARLEPNQPVVYFLKANALYKMGDLRNAKENYKAAIRLQPNYKNVFNNNPAMEYISELVPTDEERANS